MNEEQLKTWLYELRDNAGVQGLIQKLKRLESEAIEAAMNKARNHDQKVFYESGIRDGILSVIEFLENALTKPDTNPDT